MRSNTSLELESKRGSEFISVQWICSTRTNLSLALFLLSSSLEERGCVTVSLWTPDMEGNRNWVMLVLTK